MKGQILFVVLVCAAFARAETGSWTTILTASGWNCGPGQKCCGESVFYCLGLQPSSFSYVWSFTWKLQDKTPVGGTVNQVIVSVQGTEGCVAPGEKVPPQPHVLPTSNSMEFFRTFRNHTKYKREECATGNCDGVPVDIYPVINNQPIGSAGAVRGFACGCDCIDVGSVTSQFYSSGFPGWANINALTIASQQSICLAIVNVTVIYSTGGKTSPTPTPTKPTPTPNKPSPTPTQSKPSPTPSAKPTAWPTPVPTASPTSRPTIAPTATPVPGNCSSSTQCNYPNGVCQRDGKCTCLFPYQPPNCDTCTCPGNCNGFGTCNTTSCGCICDANHYGCDCSGILYPCPNACSNNGECNHFTGQCICYPGWQGPACNEPVHSCPNNCSNHGSCNTTDGYCHCNQGWKGLSCNVTINSCIPPDCNNKGVCNTTDGHCICTPPYFGPECNFQPCPSNCSNHGRCDHISGSCYCYPPYYGCDCSQSTNGSAASDLGFKMSSLFKNSPPDYIDTIAPPYDVDTGCGPLECDGNGRCDPIRHQCYCDPGYCGCNCDQPCTDEQLVLTPFGKHPKGCVHYIQKHEHVESTDDGLKIFVKNKYGEYVHTRTARCPLRLRKYVTKQKPPNQTWQTWAVYSSEEGGISNFTAQWKVPSNPTKVGSQTIFLFNGLTQQTGGGSIIQSVLQFGASEAGGGQCWSMASWIYDSAYNVAYSDLISASPGDLLSGTLTGTISTSTFVVTSENLSTRQSAPLTIRNTQYEATAYCTLEMYGVLSCEELPPGQVVFQNIAMRNEEGKLIPIWQTETPIKQCGERTTATSSEVTITF